MENFKIDENSKIKTGFVVPENYFENLESSIFTTRDATKIKVISIFKQSKYWIAAIAAIFIFGIFISIYTNKTSQESYEEEEFLTSQTDLSTEDLVDQLTENDLKTLEENLTIYDQEMIDSAIENL